MFKRENCLLRPMQEPDLEMVLQWRNTERIRASMFTDQIITLPEHRAWFERIKGDKRTLYNIFELERRPVGVVNFTEIDLRNRRCFWGFYVGEEQAPKGTGSAMGFLALEYAFETLNLHKVCGEVLVSNRTSENYHKKLGFVEEAHYIQHVFKGGMFQDVVMLALFQDKWLENKTKLFESIFG